MFIAAPIVRDNRKIIGAPAKTDFVRIFICDDVSGGEYDVLLKHEQAHIWLRHNSRKQKNFENALWAYACEIEIARNIYNQDDIDIIKRPLSRISGGVLPDSIKDLPVNIILAEEIYEWLLRNSPKTEFKCKCCSYDEESERDEEGNVAGLIEEVKKELEDSAENKKLSNMVTEKIDEIKNRKPSLTEEIDAALRYRIERESSYRRPRRGEDSDLMRKGRISTPRPPLVEIYVDRSGSFTPEKTKVAQQTLDMLLKRYGASIRYDVWFFGGGKLSATDFCGGDTPYNLVSEQINRSCPKMAIIVTDDDGCGDLEKCPKGTIALVVPIACDRTKIAERIGAKEVVI